MNSTTLLSKAALVNYPMRWVHQRGYNEYYDTYRFTFHETNMALSGCRNTEDFVYAYKKYGKSMTDNQIAYGFWYIAKDGLEKSPEFWSVIIPMVKTQIATLDRNCTNSINKFIEAAASMEL